MKRFLLAFAIMSLATAAFGAETDQDLQAEIDAATTELAAAKDSLAERITLSKRYQDAKARYEAAVAFHQSARSRQAGLEEFRAWNVLDGVTRKLKAEDVVIRKARKRLAAAFEAAARRESEPPQ